MTTGEVFAIRGRGGHPRQEISEQEPFMRAGVFVEQPEHDAGELGAGILRCVFESQGPGDDLAAGILGASGFLVLGFQATDCGIGTITTGDERGKAFVIGLAGHRTA
jgi:hypothetical protein